MRINEKRTMQRLRGVEQSKRVFIYNADIIIEFLNGTFVPTKAFLTDQKWAETLEPLDKYKFHGQKIDDYCMPMKELYELYRIYREQMPYTSQIESFFKFKIIIGKLRIRKNGWEILRFRRGAKQLLIAGPLLLRTKVNPEDLAAYPIPTTTVDKGQVEYEVKDMYPEEGNTEDVSREQI